MTAMNSNYIKQVFPMFYSPVTPKAAFSSFSIFLLSSAVFYWYLLLSLPLLSWICCYWYSSFFCIFCVVVAESLSWLPFLASNVSPPILLTSTFFWIYDLFAASGRSAKLLFTLPFVSGFTGLSNVFWPFSPSLRNSPSDSWLLANSSALYVSKVFFILLNLNYFSFSVCCWSLL